MIKPYMDRLKETREKYKALIWNDPSEVNNEIKEYTEIIKEFFSQKGEGNNIRTLYEKLNENNDYKIYTCDLKVASEKYHDYMNGMVSFCGDIRNIEVTEEATWRDRLDTAINNDSLFFNNIFGGKFNESADIPADKVMGNLEALIDLQTNASQLMEVCKNVTEGSNDLVKDSVRMCYNSIGEYYNRVIENVFESYEMVNNAVNKPSEEPTTNDSNVYVMI